MEDYIVISRTDPWEFDIPGVKVITAREFLLDPIYANKKKMRIFNLSQTYAYQSFGYYVSLLAAARGHKVIPNISTIQDMKSSVVVKILSQELDDLIKKSLASLVSEQFVLSIYFGHNVAKKYDRLSQKLFNLFQTPFIRAYFVKNDKGVWSLQNIKPIPSSEIPVDHKPYVEEFAREYFADSNPGFKKRKTYQYDLAILVHPDEKHPPSDEKALAKFARAGEKLGFNVSLIEREDFPHIAEYDALFIRTTTQVNHYTYHFAQRATAEGLVVIDDPLSIVRCSNKVYLSELMRRQKLKTPRTELIYKDNLKTVVDALGFPCVLKQPDSSFSLGVVKVKDEQEYFKVAKELLSKSELLVAQEYIPTDFDWRVTLIDGEPLFVMKYYMAKKHWQIMNWEAKNNDKYGRYECFMPEVVSPKLIRTAVNACKPIGNGLYGVDIKEVGQEFYVIEVNDNPNIDSGIEDKLLRDKLYERIMRSFFERVKARKEGR